MLNKFGPSGHGEAQVQYLDGDFRVISPGTYVRCAVTDARIPLDELKYWSVDLQEAYAVPTAVLQRHFPGAVKTDGLARRVGKGAKRRAHHSNQELQLWPVGTLSLCPPYTSRPMSR